MIRYARCSCMGCIIADCCFCLLCYDKGGQTRAETYARQKCKTLG